MQLKKRRQINKSTCPLCPAVWEVPQGKWATALTHAQL